MNTGEQIRQAQKNFRTITELKEKLEILTEHVESRKEALEEEIEENLHEAIGNARDCLERIQENINPKLESIIRERLDILKTKMDHFTKEGLDTLHKEIDKQTPILTQKVLGEVDGLVESKLMMARNELSKSVDQKIETAVNAVVSEHKNEIKKGLSGNKHIEWSKCIKWNFTKFIIDKLGRVHKRFATYEGIDEIEKELLKLD